MIFDYTKKTVCSEAFVLWIRLYYHTLNHMSGAFIATHKKSISALSPQSIRKSAFAVVFHKIRWEKKHPALER